MTARRIGRFSIDRALIESHPEVVRELMSRVIVVRCELHYAEDRFEYVALSPHFAESRIGDLIQGYDVIIHDHDGIGLRTIAFL